MKTTCARLGVVAFVSVVLTAACDNADTGKGTTTGTEQGDGGSHSDALQFNRTNCDPSKLCTGLEHPEDCVANFELGTAQAGFEAHGAFTGFYGYNDLTPGATMIPERNNDGSEPAVEGETCDGEGRYMLHVSGSGFAEWGAGIGLDWGGTDNPNPDCESDGALACKEIADADPNFLLAEAEADDRCRDENGEIDPVRMRCAIHGKQLKQIRDLSAYRGIGFWIARTDDTSDVMLKVNFGVPETTRFLTDPTLKQAYRRTDGVAVYEGGCSDDDGDDTTKCYDEFSANVRLVDSDIGKWVYKEVLFEELTTGGWGIPLPYDSFPPNKSTGIKFQTTGPDTYFDFYIDDIHFIR